MPNSQSEKPLDMVCPCGYQQKIPAEFDGKKVMCPKCQKVLRIQRVTRIAQLSVRCPYCKKSCEYDPNSAACPSCQRTFLFPDYAPKPTQSSGSDKNFGPGLINAGSGSAGPAINAGLNPGVTRRKRPNVNWMSHIVGVIIASAVLLMVWDHYGERLGLPPMPNFSRDTTLEGRSVEIDPNAPSTLVEGKAPAKLTSPSVKIHKISYEVAQALDKEKAEVAGTRLFFEIELENISTCELTSAAFAIQLTDQTKTNPSHKRVVKFEPLFKPNTTRTISADFPIADLTKAKVSVLRVTSGLQADTTLVEKMVEF